MTNGTHPKDSGRELRKYTKVPRDAMEIPVNKVVTKNKGLLGILSIATEANNERINLHEDTIKEAWSLSMEEPDSWKIVTM